LDRPDLKNPVEKKALAAIKHVARVIVYILDPTLACGWRLDEQVELLHKTTERFPDKKVLVLINKADVATQEEMNIAHEAVKDYTSVKDGEGFTGKDELLEKISKVIV
jgi:nucleolar GTP-binding protein